MRVVTEVFVFVLVISCSLSQSASTTTQPSSTGSTAAKPIVAAALDNATLAFADAGLPIRPPTPVQPAEQDLKNEIQRHFEFEDVLSDTQQNYWVWRSEASNRKVLRLEDKTRTHRIEFLLCIEPFDFGKNAIFRLDDIRYGNDGPSDVVFITLNDAPFASFLTHEKWRSGHEWNVFRNSHEIGFPVELEKGTHKIQISVITDDYGIELDKIRVNVENQDPNKDLFCGASLSVV